MLYLVKKKIYKQAKYLIIGALVYIREWDRIVYRHYISKAEKYLMIPASVLIVLHSSSSLVITS